MQPVHELGAAYEMLEVYKIEAGNFRDPGKVLKSLGLAASMRGNTP